MAKGSTDRRRRSGSGLGLLLALPAIILLGLFLLWPILVGVEYSFYDASGFGGKEFTGLENYRMVLEDHRFWAAMGRNVILALVVVVATVLIGFVLAYGLYIKLRGWRVYQVLLMIPYITPVVVVGLLWKFMLEPTSGLVNVLLEGAGLGFLASGWLSDPSTALPTASMVYIWSGAPFVVLLLFSGMVSLPQEVMEAAQIDGAGHLRRMFWIIFPMLRPLIALVTLITVIGNFRSFDLMYVLTAGGPINSTTIGTLYVYIQGFINSKYGYANAVGVVLGLILVAALLVPRLIRSAQTRTTKAA